jgi:hypothetical protein
MDIRWLVISVILLLATIAMAVVVITTSLSLQNNIAAVKNRAQTCANADEMYERLVKLDQRMEQRGMTSGYCSLFKRNDWTNMAEVRRNIRTLIERADQIRQLAPTSDAYQQGLDDLRGTTREINLHQFGWWIYNRYGWVFLYLLGPLATGLFIIAGIKAFWPTIKDW